MNKKLLFGSNIQPELVLRYTFFEELQPVLFAAEDEKKSLYLCVLCDDRNSFRWIVSPTKRWLLSEMMDNKRSIYQVFYASQNLGRSLIIEKNETGYICRRMKFSELPTEDLPTSGYMFDADEDEILDFRRSFMNSRGVEQGADGKLHYFCSNSIGNKNREYWIGNCIHRKRQMLQAKQIRFLGTKKQRQVF